MSRRLVASFSQPRPEFDSRASPCYVCGGRSGSEKILVPVLRVSSVGTVQAVLHTNFHMSYQDTLASACKPSNVAMLFEISGKFKGKVF